MGLAAHGELDRTVDEIMHRDLTTAFADESLRVVADRMVAHRFRALPVVERDRPDHLVGVVTESDLLRAREQRLLEERHRERVLRLTALPLSDVRRANRTARPAILRRASICRSWASPKTGDRSTSGSRARRSTEGPAVRRTVQPSRGCRDATRLLRSYHPGLEVRPFAQQQVADAGDIACNPFDIQEAIAQIESGAEEIVAGASRLLSIGGDHTIALPLPRVMNRRHGPVALLHFDAHLDTWDTYFGAEYTHGTPFRRAWEEGLLLQDHAMHVGIRGPLFSPEDLVDDERFGFAIVGAMEMNTTGVADVVGRVRERLADAPVYVSIDIDVLDPAHAPGTGTPEAGGLTSRELLGILRGLAGVNVVGADIVEVAPPSDHAEITAMAASHVAYELLALFASRP